MLITHYVTCFFHFPRLNRGDHNQSTDGIGTGCYDDMALNAGGGLVLLNHESSALGGYGVVSSGGDCLLTGNSKCSHPRDSNAYKTTTELLQLCDSAGYRVEHGGRMASQDLVYESTTSPRCKRFVPSSGGIYSTATAYQYGSRMADGNHADNDNIDFMTPCTCSYDGRHNSEQENSTSITAVSSEADLLHQQQQQQVSYDNETGSHQVSFTDELVSQKLYYDRCSADECIDQLNVTLVGSSTSTSYERANQTKRVPTTARASDAFDADIKTKTHQPLLSAVSANTIPRGYGVKPGNKATESTGLTGYDTISSAE